MGMARMCYRESHGFLRAAKRYLCLMHPVNSFMPRLKGLGNIVAELRAERAHLVNNLRHVDAALAVLGKLEGGKFATVSRRTLSATARRKIAAAQKARWAKVKAKQEKSK